MAKRPRASSPLKPPALLSDLPATLKDSDWVSLANGLEVLSAFIASMAWFWIRPVRFSRHGRECAYAALRIDDKFIGAPDRSLSYPSNVWEYCNAESDSDYTYYVPVTKEMLNRRTDVVVLILRGGYNDVKPELWITAYPVPFESKELVLMVAK